MLPYQLSLDIQRIMWWPCLSFYSKPRSIYWYFDLELAETFQSQVIYKNFCQKRRQLKILTTSLQTKNSRGEAKSRPVTEWHQQFQDDGLNIFKDLETSSQFKKKVT